MIAMTKKHKVTIPRLSDTRMTVTSYLLSLLMVILLVLPITEPVFADTDSWIQTSQADFEAGILDNVDTTSSSGDLQLAASDFFIYALQGNDQQSFWRYDRATGCRVIRYIRRFSFARESSVENRRGMALIAAKNAPSGNECAPGGCRPFLGRTNVIERAQ